ncbi:MULTISPECIES: FAD-binding oxidoreductase [unclassified Bacillus (in: firmicutes)]|uniref:NAD(P)/FAD-dependent oxidoreductase n=1 Tax=unclassified Bacillus (in: firmicutes) TaxID=185979 RepID=UPI0008EED9E7|nr:MULTISPECIES: FAD-dependent oxidoreductase [unclassified Bacillus (in: firmicutes)]SFA79590.1 Glycine/D-amino acid oxidase [Bacillus sp. UNCCL13]SFQ69638.1 Glycine/D-amino acid oxidase [Bacillus sp. cl95]
MKLHNGSLYWPNTLQPKDWMVEQSEKANKYDIVIIGGGMAGALSAYALIQEGLKVAIIDKGKMGMGSSAANTGLLQFSNDIMLHELSKQIGEDKAVRFYKLCQTAMDQLAAVAQSLPFESDFIRRKSIYYASMEEDVDKLRKEFYALKKNGFPTDYWTNKEMTNHLPFSKPGALVTYGDAEVNPLKFIRGILTFLQKKGVHLFEETEVLKVKEQSEHVTVETSLGNLRASNVIFATGYEPLPILNALPSDINRSYAIATEPIPDLSEWIDQALIWETKRPYLYLRTTADGRIIAGGLDENISFPPENEDWIHNRAQRLKQEVEKLFPMLPIKIAHAWGASFGESLDNLPFIGVHPGKKRLFYLLGYGGNGTVYSMLGSHILRDLILKRPNDGADIVSLTRSSRKRIFQKQKHDLNLPLYG